MRIYPILTLLLGALIAGCSSHEELPPPDNPFDPGNPEYVSPSVEITGGPIESEVVGNTAVTFQWQGNESATEFSYQFDESDWSNWIADTSILFDYLDEGAHSFKLKARSVNGEEQETFQAVDFSIDGVGGPSALIYPYKQSCNPGDTLMFQVMAEEVTDLFAVELEVTFNSDYLQLLDISNGSITSEWGGLPLFVHEVHENSISISQVAVEGTITSFSGSTSLINLGFRVQPDAVIDPDVTKVIEVREITYLNSNMDFIPVHLLRSGGLDVQ